MSDEEEQPHERTPGKIARVVTEAILGAHPVVAALNVKLAGEYKEQVPRRPRRAHRRAGEPDPQERQ